MKRVITATTSENTLKDLIIDAYLDLSKSMGWTREELEEQYDPMLEDDSEYLDEVEYFIRDEYEGCDTVKMRENVEDDDGTTVVSVYFKGQLQGEFLMCYSGGRIFIEAIEK